MTEKATAAKDANKAPAIQKEVAELATKLQTQITEAAKSSQNIDNSMWTANLPEGVTPELDDKLRDHRTNFRNATALAYGRAMIGIVADSDGKVKEGNISIGMGGRDAVEHHFQDREEFTNRMDKDNPVTVVKHGHMVTKVVVSGTSGSSGQLAAVRKTIGAEAAARLAK